MESLERNILIPVRLWHKNGAVPSSRSPRPPRLLDPSSLEALALFYVGRFATTRARLIDYLRRKLRERGWGGEGEPPVEAIADRCVELGYVDDAAFAVGRSASLLRRGYGGRRVAQALHGAGIDRELIAANTPDDDAALAAAEAYARRRKLGIFGQRALDRAERARQVATMVRAGHGYDVIRHFICDPGSDDI